MSQVSEGIKEEVDRIFRPLEESLNKLLNLVEEAVEEALEAIPPTYAEFHYGKEVSNV